MGRYDGGFPNMNEKRDKLKRGNRGQRHGNPLINEAIETALGLVLDIKTENGSENRKSVQVQ